MLVVSKIRHSRLLTTLFVSCVISSSTYADSFIGSISGEIDWMGKCSCDWCSGGYTYNLGSGPFSLESGPTGGNLEFRTWNGSFNASGSVSYDGKDRTTYNFTLPNNYYGSVTVVAPDRCNNIALEGFVFYGPTGTGDPDCARAGARDVWVPEQNVAISSCTSENAPP